MSADHTWINGFNPKKRFFIGSAYHAVKRALDLFLVILFAPVWVPLGCLIALAIKVSSPGGEVVFVQQRTGKGGHRFGMYKFRTMVPNAEELKVKYAHLNELKWPDFKITNDPRITPLGRVLRKTSLDELPQLLNVLRGEMSLVGPRPTSWSPQSYQLWHTERLDVIPGLTGLWQIAGRAQVEFDDRLRLDIAYIERASLWLDIVILIKTVIAVFKQKGAH